MIVRVYAPNDDGEYELVRIIRDVYSVSRYCEDCVMYYHISFLGFLLEPELVPGYYHLEMDWSEDSNEG